MSQDLSNTEPQNPYSKLFATNQPKRVQIMAAATRLAMLVEKVLIPGQLEIWADVLQAFSSENLAYAFQMAEATIESWPKPAQLTRLIFEREFAADYAWLLSNLAIHRPDWHDISEKREWQPEWKEEPGKVIQQAIAAPAIPGRVERALSIFGRGTSQDGLRALWPHPKCREWGYDNSEALRIKGDLDKSFKAAWMQARGEEMA